MCSYENIWFSDGDIYFFGTSNFQMRITFYVMIPFQVYGWGRGEHGRLGFGDNDKSSKMVPQKVNLLAGEDIVQVPSMFNSD